MIRKFNRIPGNYWTDVIGKGLSPTARVTEIYLLTCPNSNSIGIFMEHPSSIAYSTGLKEKQVDETLKELSGAGRLYREAGNWIFVVPRWSFEYGGNNFKNLKGALGLLKAANANLASRFGEIYPDFSTKLQALQIQYEHKKAGEKKPAETITDANGDTIGDRT